MMYAVYVALNDYFTFLDKLVGLENVVVALSGEHGVAPTMRSAVDEQMPAAAIKTAAVMKGLEAELEKRWPLPGAAGEERDGVGEEFGDMQLNQKLLEAALVAELEAGSASADAVVV